MPVEVHRSYTQGYFLRVRLHLHYQTLHSNLVPKIKLRAADPLEIHNHLLQLDAHDTLDQGRDALKSAPPRLRRTYSSHHDHSHPIQTGPTNVCIKQEAQL